MSKMLNRLTKGDREIIKELEKLLNLEGVASETYSWYNDEGSKRVKLLCFKNTEVTEKAFELALRLEKLQMLWLDEYMIKEYQRFIKKFKKKNVFIETL